LTAKELSKKESVNATKLNTSKEQEGESRDKGDSYL